MVSTRRTKRSSLEVSAKFKAANDDDERMEISKAPKGGIQKNKSNRWWKKRQTTPHSAINKVKPLHTKWKTKMKRKADDQHVKAQQAVIREVLQAERVEKAEKRKEREERRKRNIEKSEVVQIIRNTERLKRLNKKQLQTIKKRDITSVLQATNK